MVPEIIVALLIEAVAWWLENGNNQYQVKNFVGNSDQRNLR
jgi:hypothetical protein